MAKYWLTVVALGLLLVLFWVGWDLFRELFGEEIREKRAKKRSETMPPCCVCRRYRIGSAKKGAASECVLFERDKIDNSEIRVPCEEIRGADKCRPVFDTEGEEVRCHDLPDNERGGNR